MPVSSLCSPLFLLSVRTSAGAEFHFLHALCISTLWLPACLYYLWILALYIILVKHTLLCIYFLYNILCIHYFMYPSASLGQSKLLINNQPRTGMKEVHMVPRINPRSQKKLNIISHYTNANGQLPPSPISRGIKPSVFIGLRPMDLLQWIYSLNPQQDAQTPKSTNFATQANGNGADVLPSLWTRWSDWIGWLNRII